MFISGFVAAKKEQKKSVLKSFEEGNKLTP